MLWIYLAPAAINLTPTPSGQAIATIHHGPTTVTIYNATPDPGPYERLDLFVHRAGSNITHVLGLGLGRDGRVAGGVLASVRAMT